MMTERPERDEAAEYFFRYIDLVEHADIVATLEKQHAESLTFFRSIPEQRAHHRYAPDKWTVSGVLAHINDCERMFSFRAFWFARGLEGPLPSFDQEIGAKHDGSDARSLASLIAEFDALRQASISLFKHLPQEAWTRRGIASGNPFSVRALAYTAAGHVLHHRRVLEARYLRT
jgi:hypothetical protein